MSIDYLIFNFNGPLPSNEEMGAKGYSSPPLGLPDFVKAEISRYLPGIAWSDDDPHLGYISDQGYGIHFRLQIDDQGQVSTIGVHPYGIAEAEQFMQKFCVPNLWYVFDPQSGIWIHPTRLGEWDEPNRSEPK